MKEDEAFSLAESWIAYWRTAENSIEREAMFWVSDREWELVHESPREAWQLILAVLARDDSSAIQEVLSAGPLEDLLVLHGAEMIALVEAEAGSNPKFARLLGGVWQRDMPEDIWSRVQKAWDRRGWDGIPEA